MPRPSTSATRSNMLAIRQRLKLARDGYRLLDRKRDVLVSEIVRFIEEAERIQAEAQERFRRAYESLQEARASIGTERVRRIAGSRPHEVDVRITPRSVMGVAVPSVECHVPQRKLFYALGDTSGALDEAQNEWVAVVGLLGRLAEVTTTVWRLAFELRRTQRRVNALENLFIPSYEETLRYIQETLEEKDREDLFRLKRAKSKLAPGEPEATSTGFTG